MRKSVYTAAAVLGLLLPLTASAAYNDVTLTTSTVIKVGSYTLNVSGSSAVIQSIVVNPGSFQVTLASGSSITVSSAALNQLSSDVTSDVTANTCNGSASSIALSYSGAGTVTNTITPSATICTNPAPTPTPTPTPASGGGGGGGALGGGFAPISQIPFAISVSTSSLAKPVIASVPGCPPHFTCILSVNSVTASSSTSTLSQLRVLLGAAPMLSVGSSNEYVLNLQKYLIAIAVGPAAKLLAQNGASGYFGRLTRNALIEFQIAARIRPSVGMFGPKTKAYILSQQ